MVEERGASSRRRFAGGTAMMMQLRQFDKISAIATSPQGSSLFTSSTSVIWYKQEWKSQGSRNRKKGTTCKAEKVLTLTSGRISLGEVSE